MYFLITHHAVKMFNRRPVRFLTISYYDKNNLPRKLLQWMVSMIIFMITLKLQQMLTCRCTNTIQLTKYDFEILV